VIGTILINETAIGVFFDEKGKVIDKVYVMAPQIPYPKELTPTEDLAAWYNAIEHVTKQKEKAYHEELIES